MNLVEINEATCTRCGACVAACGSSILVPGADGLPSLFPGADAFCLRCGHCVAVCPSDSVAHRDLPLDACPPVAGDFPIPLARLTGHIQARRAVRAFDGRPVPRALIEQVLEAARYAPSGHNRQEVGWRVIDCRDEIHKLLAVALDWAGMLAAGDGPLAGEMRGILRMHSLGMDLLLRGAPALVIAFAEAGDPIAPVDCAIALTTFDLAAPGVGLGCFWNAYFTICAQTYPAMAAALALPEGSVPYGTLCAGFPRFHYRRIPPRRPARVLYSS